MSSDDEVIDGSGPEPTIVEETKIEAPVVNGGGHRRHVSFVENEAEKFSVSRKNRLFGGKKPVHAALGGGKPADVILWRNKPESAGMLAAGTVIWLLFELIGYHLLTFLCHSLILSLALVFLWSNLSCFINKSTLNIPEITLPEELFNNVALSVTDQINLAFKIFREMASGKDLKKFLYTVLAVWVVSIIGSWFNFLTLIYIMFVMVLTGPLLYEMHEDQVDTYAEKATIELKKQYSVLDEKVLQKLSNVPFVKGIKHVKTFWTLGASASRKGERQLPIDENQ